MKRIVRWSPEFLKHFDNFIFDCDGVLWRGERVIDGIPDMIRSLQTLGKNVVLCSNNATKPRDKYVKILQNHDVTISKADVYTSAYTAAAYVSNLPVEIFDPSRHKVLVNGSNALNDELSSRGIPSINIHDVITKGMSNSEITSPMDFLTSHIPDPSVRAVICGLDQRLSYSSISLAHRYLTEMDGNNEERIFIATNCDPTFPVTAGIHLPGSGSVISLLQTSTGRTPFVMGKPERYMLDAILTDKGFDKNRTLMIGDRLDTDVSFASRLGIHSLLVLTGVMSCEKLVKYYKPKKGEHQHQHNVVTQEHTHISHDANSNSFCFTSTIASSSNCVTCDQGIDRDMTSMSLLDRIQAEEVYNVPTFVTPTAACLTIEYEKLSNKLEFHSIVTEMEIHHRAE